MPRLSIITINYNNIEGLRKTLASVASQTDKNFEYIIVDGASTDGSIDIIRENEDCITTWISEKDNGVYDAMNKGVKMASGEYVIFVNSGDKLYDSTVIKQLNQLSFCTDICIGKVNNIFTDGKSYLWTPPKESSLSLHYLRWQPLHHPGALIRRELQLKYPYDPDLKICADRKFFLESLILGDASYSTIPVIINEFGPQGLSGPQSEHKMNDEDDIILQDLFPKRLYRDITATNWMIQSISSVMARYYGKTKVLCNINRYLMKLMRMK